MKFKNEDELSGIRKKGISYEKIVKLISRCLILLA